MDQNLPIKAKKLWKLIKVVYFMLRKGIAKGKLLADLSTIIKRGKVAGKAAMHDLMFSHHRAGAAVNRFSDEPQVCYPVPLDEYEFSCSNSPAFRLPIFNLNKRKRLHAPPSDGDLMAAAVEMVNSVAESPALPGFGRTPTAIRQIRVMDSPAPLGFGNEDDCHVDEAAEKFIMKFYKDLKRQSLMAS